MWRRSCFFIIRLIFRFLIKIYNIFGFVFGSYRTLWSCLCPCRCCIGITGFGFEGIGANFSGIGATFAGTGVAFGIGACAGLARSATVVLAGIGAGLAGAFLLGGPVTDCGSGPDFLGGAGTGSFRCKLFLYISTGNRMKTLQSLTFCLAMEFRANSNHVRTPLKNSPMIPTRPQSTE